MILLPQPDIDAVRQQLPFIEKAREFTAGRMAAMKEAVVSFGLPKEVLIVANGSYARGEASAESDLDFLVMCTTASDVASIDRLMPEIKAKLFDVSGKSHGEDHTFGNVDTATELLKNIGGNNDTNQTTTRRVLFLLEGASLSKHNMLHTLRSDLISAYVKPSIMSHQIALFLLNDIIRYYRTICVDFEFKTVGNVDGQLKPWGTRNIKLIFSRKLLYFSGLVTIAATAQSGHKMKVATIKHLLDLPVVDRHHSLLRGKGNSKSSPL